MITKFLYEGHEYQVVPIEGNDEEFNIVKDGKYARKATKNIAQQAMQYVDKLFK